MQGLALIDSSFMADRGFKQREALSHREAHVRDEESLEHRGRTVAIGTSEVFDADGKKVTVASGSALVLPGRPATVTTELTPSHPLDAAHDE
jgi:hypothetical protein